MSRIKEAVELLERLLENRDAYFDKRGYLNSEGMKIVVRIARIIAEELPHRYDLIRSVREKRDYEMIAKLLRDLEERLSY